MSLPPSPAFAALNEAASERILILDGAMGTQIQALGLGEDDYTGHGSGHVCRHHTDHPQQGNNDLLILTQPEAVEEIHYRYAMAGADVESRPIHFPRPPLRRPIMVWARRSTT